MENTITCHVDAMQIMYGYTVESLHQLWDITSIDSLHCIYMTSNCIFHSQMCGLTTD